MKAISTLILATGVAFSGQALAAEKISAGKAMSLCKAEAISAHSDYVSSKSKRIKQVRTGFKVSMRVRLAEKTINANCEVAKDGTVNYGAS